MPEYEQCEWCGFHHPNMQQLLGMKEQPGMVYRSNPLACVRWLSQIVRGLGSKVEELERRLKNEERRN